VISFLGIYSREMETYSYTRLRNMNVQNRIFGNSPKLEKSRCPSTDKQIIGILFSIKKE
jgi:hypothetical protein